MDLTSNSQPHLKASLGRIPKALPSAIPTASTPPMSIISPLIRRVCSGLPPLSTPLPGHNYASVALPWSLRNEAAGYRTHPALGDACIHLAAVPASAAAAVLTRVPVAAACFLAASPASASGTAVAESVRVNADQSSDNNIRWVEGLEASRGGLETPKGGQTPGAGTGRFQVLGLQAKRVPGTASGRPKPEQEISYLVEWQAHCPPGLPAGVFGRQRLDGSRACWRVEGASSALVKPTGGVAENMGVLVQHLQVGFCSKRAG